MAGYERDAAQARLVAYVSLTFSALSVGALFLSHADDDWGGRVSMFCALVALVSGLTSIAVRMRCAPPKPITPVLALLLILAVLTSYLGLLYVGSQLHNFSDQ